MKHVRPQTISEHISYVKKSRHGKQQLKVVTETPEDIFSIQLYDQQIILLR